ncbi:MAG: DUF1328 domain-containing protein [Caulobacteraceae bacterium]|nr:DUF1328 domain-containing protein [Caulobacteraceae bacterium]
MLYWTLCFAAFAVLAGALGFFALAGIAAAMAKVLFLVFAALLLISFLIQALPGRPRPRQP